MIRVLRILGIAALSGLAVPVSTARAQAPKPGQVRAILPPKLVKFVEAPFPESEKESGKGGNVVLQIAITETGAVAAVAVLESAGAAFDAAASEAAKRFVFEPASINGKPLPVKITYKYEFVFRQEYIQKKTADFDGVVRDSGSKEPLPAVKVALDSGQSAITDEKGHFRIEDVEPGDHVVTLSGEKLNTVTTQETFEASKEVGATYDVEPKSEKGGDDDDSIEVVIVVPKFVKQVVSTEIAAEEGRRVPGTQGDVLKVVENLPGVARSAVGSGQLVVWGAAPEDTRVYVDGLRVPRLYHNGGYRSIINSDLVKSVELVPGGYGPAFGRGLGGLVNVSLRPLYEEGIHGSAGVDAIDAALSVRAKVSDDFHVAIAGRRSHLDQVLQAVTSRDIGEIVPVPRYYDGQALIVHDLAKNETITLGGLLSSDELERTQQKPDPAESKREIRNLSFQRVWVEYQRRGEDKSLVTVLPSFGLDHSRTYLKFGAQPTQLEVDSKVYGFRASYRREVDPHLSVHVGLDMDAMASEIRRSGSVASPPREGDIRVFGQPPADQINVDTWNTVQGSIAPYGEIELALFDNLRITPGVRFEPYVVTGSRLTPVVGDTPSIGFAREQTVVEPRISLRYTPTDRLTVKAAFGIYHQAPVPEDMSAVFGNPALGLSSAKNVLAGGAFRLTGTLGLEITGFFTQSEDLITRSILPNPLLSRALEQTGVGRSYGTQFLLRQEQIGRFFGWLSYSIVRSERADTENSPYRLFDYDQSHNFTAVGSYDLGAGFEFGARLRFSTGFPRTPVTGAFFDSRSDSYQPLFGPRNSGRLPPFFQADVRLAKRFKIAASEAEIYLDVQNVSNRSNPEEVVYNYNYTQKNYINGLPVMPVIGAKWTW